jgi:hypothetical protein
MIEHLFVTEAYYYIAQLDKVLRRGRWRVQQ